MKLRKLLIFLFVFFSSLVIFGQIKVSEFIQTSKLSETDNNALYFIDFWATWCGPCIHASKYLETLQKQNPNNFYIISLTKENPEAVKQFIRKHKTGLAIAIDFKGETYRKHKVLSLPYGVLYNAEGTKLWEGHPAEFKQYHIKRYLKRNSKRIAVNEMFQTSIYKEETSKEAFVLNKDFEFFRLKEDLNFNSLQIKKLNGVLELKGNLKDILAYTLHVYKKQINLSEDLNESYQMQFKLDSNAFFNQTETIMKALSINKQLVKDKGEVLVFNIVKPTFWDTRQIEWGNDSPHFLIGEADIQADNVSLSRVKYQLSNLLETPVLLEDYVDDSKLHDWQIHYKYFDLMVANMNDNYGIKIEKKITDYTQYVITKKAP
ncbi:TlpA family protein disulfide reductase [Flavivirga eckloniae]|nr:TlpA disulfide reductase family protein [Flavivirga eckloniae]